MYLGNQGSWYTGKRHFQGWPGRGPRMAWEGPEDAKPTCARAPASPGPSGSGEARVGKLTKKASASSCPLQRQNWGV